MQVNNISLNISIPRNQKSFGSLKYEPKFLENIKKNIFEDIPILEQQFMDTFNTVEKIQAKNPFCNLKFCEAVNINKGRNYPTILVEDPLGGHITYFYVKNKSPESFIKMFEMANNFASGFKHPEKYPIPSYINSSNIKLSITV